MTLRRKSFLIVAACSIGLFLILYLIANFVLVGGLLRLERRDTEQNVERTLKAISDEISRLDVHVHDWAQWDDSYLFIQGKNPDYPDSTLLDQTFSAAMLNLVIYLDKSGRVIFQKAFDLKNNHGIRFPEDLFKHLKPGFILVKHLDKTSSAKGIVILDQGPVILASRPILPSSGEGPIMGTIIMGRFLDREMIEAISESIRLTVAIYDYQSAGLPPDFAQAKELLKQEPKVVIPQDGDIVAGYGIVKDIYGSPHCWFESRLTGVSSISDEG